MRAVYLAIKGLFTFVTFVFYHGVFCPGVKRKVAPPGTPAILCFNHRCEIEHHRGARAGVPGGAGRKLPEPKD